MPYKKNMYKDVNDFCEYIECFISNVLNEPVKIFNDVINDVFKCYSSKVFNKAVFPSYIRDYYVRGFLIFV
jgi:hypothetical protein